MGNELRFRFARLAARQWLTPEYVRIRPEGADLRGFDSPGSDDHIRVFFPGGEPASVDELRAAPSREYTPLAWDADGGWLDLEFAITADTTRPPRKGSLRRGRRAPRSARPPEWAGPAVRSCSRGAPTRGCSPATRPPFPPCAGSRT
ncbi:siderophore-interacting protein [Microbacterium lacticum]|uniref:siderophore-interacting protein n=1 Tax=Microbacterium lacticum TaxID=33885 RepID=UPI0011679E42|nr:siderophore-interacting protein [Microbacterium lacticum]GEB94903.1 hypothetical protein MLA01_11220 [Microbacterium lacticum]GGN19960.1 hypothetical protein GCM10009724_12570 [Microbacterium lacticum]